MPGKNSKKGPSQRKAGAADKRSKNTSDKSSSKGTAVRGGKAPRLQAPTKEAAAGRTPIQRDTPLVDLGRVWERIGSFLPIEFRVSFIRPDDLLVCDFVFDNMTLAAGSPNKLIRRNPERFATLIVELPPQSFGEEAFLDATGPEVASKPPAGQEFQETSQPPKNTVKNNAELHDPLPFARIRMAGRSRLAFLMPGNETELPFTLDAVLDACRRWPMRLGGGAVPEEHFLSDLLLDGGVFNKDWLKGVVLSSDVSISAQMMIDAMGGANVLRKSLTDAARRIAARAGDALIAGATRETATAIHSAMNDELDAAAIRYAPLREAATREVALAALSLMTTEKLAASKGGEFSAAPMKDFPFLSVSLPPHEPSPVATALELPYRVILSPIPRANWWHETKPVVHNGRTELWHTRLTDTADGVGPDSQTKVRALWSPDYPLGDDVIIDAVNNVPPKPFRMSLDPLDRQMLVKLTAGFDDRTPKFKPRAVRSQRLSLSALGGLLDVEGSWEHLPAGVGLEQWRHLATLGRDHYVRVVYRGFLCWPGNSASLIKVTERKFESMSGSGTKDRVAMLRQRFFIVVREPIKYFSGEGHTSHGYNFPFRSVEILTRVTPSLLAPEKCKLGDPASKQDDKIYGPIGGKTPNRACFWPMIDPSTNFVFQMAATDVCGGRVTFAMPLLFVGVEANQKPKVMEEVLRRYNAEVGTTPFPSRRTTSLGNASVGYAPVPADPKSKGDPRLPTQEMTFDAAGVNGISTDKPQFYPEVETAQVGIAAIQRLLQQPNAVVRVEYPEVYKSGGFGPGNPGEVFLKTLQPYGLDFGGGVKSDALGGLATPSMAIQGLSRIMGPVAAQPPSDLDKIEEGLAQVINNNFNPADFFKDAKILGGVDLADILGTLPKVLKGDNVPKLLSKQLPDRVEASFDWKTKINDSDPAKLFVPNAGGEQTRLEMQGVVTASASGTTFTANASIVNFKVNLFGFVTIWFDNLKFSSKSGSKPDVAVDLHPTNEAENEYAIEFGGPLEFVNELRNIIPSNGFSDPPSLSVTPSGISASYSINIPSLAVGIFALEHVSLGAGFSLPFDAKPAEVRFNFAERQRPFSLTVSLLGGGGFFAIGLGTEGVREIEAALEFGAALSINLGVASGSVEIKAGVYFHWLSQSVELAGYVRVHGELSVLGLISASITFNLQLAYLKEGGRSVVWGEASVEIEIDVLFFSFSVSVKCRREFGGSDSDPKFIELIPDEATWESYCDRFALEA